MPARSLLDDRERSLAASIRLCAARHSLSASETRVLAVLAETESPSTQAGVGVIDAQKLPPLERLSARHSGSGREGLISAPLHAFLKT